MALREKIEALGLKDKAEGNANKTKVLKAEYKAKEKTKALTTSERLDRIEKLLGI